MSPLRLAILRILSEEEKPVSDWTVGARLDDLGFDVYEHPTGFTWPSVAMQLGHLKNMGLVVREEAPHGYGWWKLSLEGYAVLGIDPDTKGIGND